MKSRMLLFSITLLLTGFLAHGQQTEKTLVKAFNLAGNRTVLLDFDGAVEVHTWSQEQMRIQMVITLEHGTEVILKSLVQAGRYNMSSDDATGEFKVTVPGTAKPIKMKSGQDVGERVTYIVHAPANVLVKTKIEATLEGSALIKSSF